jgi:transposase InsO family protein
MQTLAGFNKGTRYLLTYIDIFSKYFQVRAIKNKTTVVVTAALKDILDNMPASWRPKTLQSDNGSEFKNYFESMLHDRGIKTIHSLAYSPQSQGSVERVNRLLKSAIFALMDRNKTKQYLQYLEPLAENFNTSQHGTTGYKPLDIMNSMPLSDQMIEHIQDRMRTRIKHTVQSDREYEVGDIVRVALTTEAAIRRDKFRKRIKANWSTGVFEIYSISDPVTAGTQKQYLLKNLTTNRKSIKRYWNYQLQPATIPDEEIQEEEINYEDEEDLVPERIPPHPLIRVPRSRELSAQALRNIARD